MLKAVALALVTESPWGVVNAVSMGVQCGVIVSVAENVTVPMTPVVAVVQTMEREPLVLVLVPTAVGAEHPVAAEYVGATAGTGRPNPGNPLVKAVARSVRY